MYVCICNAVSDRAIVNAIDTGARSLECLVDRLEVATGCGSCEVAVREHLARRLAELGLSEFLEHAAA